MCACVRVCGVLRVPHLPAPHSKAVRTGTGWPRGMEYLICVGLSPQKKTANSDSFAERHLQLKASYASSPPCTWQRTRRGKNATPEVGCRRIPGFPNVYSLLCVRIKASVYTYVSCTYRYTHTYTYMYAHIYMYVFRYTQMYIGLVWHL